MPCRTRSRARMSMSKAISSSMSARMRAAERGSRRKRGIRIRDILGLPRVEHAVERRHVGAQVGRLRLERRAAGGGELVEAGPPIRLAHPPRGAHELAL